MALAPLRLPLRSMVLLLSQGKPQLSSLFSSIPTATPETDTPAGTTVKPPAAQGGSIPVAPPVQPPPVPRSGSSCHRSVATPEGVLHRIPKDPLATTTKTRTQKRSSKKHANNHQACEDPYLGVAEGPPRMSSHDKPKHPIHEPRTRIQKDAIDKHSACGLQEDPKHSIPDGSLCSSTLQPLPDKLPRGHPEYTSSHDDPPHPVREPAR